ncbi:anamorsin homolog [Ananas comosus]|uniref:Anamorsin homolog n=1 Tax=Ananas comosus TaxID=4615 RepID=A0A6P5GX09_ANACO|nr:anamorsin homolog [Ananas comosus]
MGSAGMENGVLVLTDEIALPISVIRDLQSESVSEDDDVVVITQCGSLGAKLPFGPASFDVVVAVSSSSEFFTERWLEEIGRVLKPRGKILLQTFIEQDKPSSALERKLLMSGFLEVQTFEAKALLPYEKARIVSLEGKKASWTIGSSFPLKKEKIVLPKIQIDDESDLIDEDSLLTEEDLKKPQLPIVGDCELGSTRKACKNCVCGRAEAEAKVEKLGLTAEQINNPQSACGSCGLGDAFRCSGCPYRGLPPFKSGEKVSLPSNFLVADI